MSSRLAAAQLKYSNIILALEVKIDQTSDCIVSCKVLDGVMNQSPTLEAVSSHVINASLLTAKLMPARPT